MGRRKILKCWLLSLNEALGVMFYKQGRIGFAGIIEKIRFPGERGSNSAILKSGIWVALIVPES